MSSGRCAPNLSADICWEPDRNTWRASVSEHPQGGGPGTVVWQRRGMRTEHNAASAMDAAYRRLRGPDVEESSIP